jgi:hypothetical protein
MSSKDRNIECVALDLTPHFADPVNSAFRPERRIETEPHHLLAQTCLAGSGSARPGSPSAFTLVNRRSATFEGVSVMPSTSALPGASEPDPPPGVRRWLISCDETGLHGARYYGFGALWMSWQRRGNFLEWIAEIRREHPEHRRSEFKWNHVNKQTLATYRDLVALFFRRVPLCFHCLLVEKAVIDKARHEGDYDLARRKFFTRLLTCKIANALRARPDRDQTFRVWVDPIASRYPKADEVVEIVANHVLRRDALAGRSRPVVDGVIEHDSKDTPSIQLCDVLLGAVAATWQKEPVVGAKLELQRFIAEHLGWQDFCSDNRPNDRKFNILMFYDPTRQARRVPTREVRLRYRMPLLPSPPKGKLAA